MGAGQKNQVFSLCNRIIRLGYAVGFPLIILSIISFNPLFNIYSDNESLIQIAQLPFLVALLNYAFALPGYVYMNAVTGTSATRTTFIFQTVTILPDLFMDDKQFQHIPVCILDSRILICDIAWSAFHYIS